MIGILDNGDENLGKEKGARIERLRVSLGFYQAILKPEASVVGDGTEKGVIQIRDDVMDELRVESFSGAYNPPFYIRGNATKAIYHSDNNGFVALKTIDIEYLREVIEAT
jgi:hypothetical protein